MNRTLGIAVGFAVIVAGLLSIASEPAGAQAGAISGYVVPRTPWGDPDLQGNLTNLYETGTPLEKPDAFAGRRMEDVTKEEVRAERERIEKRAIERRLNAPGVQGGTPEIFLDA